MIGALALAAAIVTLPFSFFDNRMLVQGNINGVPGFTLIFDTGAHGIILTPEAASRLHLSRAPGARVEGAGARLMPASRARLQSFALGAYVRNDVPALILDLSVIRKALHFPHLDGVVGYDAIRTPYLVANIDRQALTLSNSLPSSPAGAHVVPVTGYNGLLHVEAAIDGVHDDVVIDTGDRSALTVFQRFGYRNFFNAESARVRNTVTGYGIGGVIRSDVFQSHLDVFGFSIPDVPARLPLGAAGVFTTATEAGSIGGGILKRFNIIYDRFGHRLVVWPSKVSANVVALPDAGELRRHATFGAALQNKNGASIMRVIAGGPAAKAGVVAGDTILNVGHFATPDVTAFLAALHLFHAGQSADVAVRRNGAVKTLHVTFGAPANESDPAVTTTYGGVEVDGTLRRTLTTYPKDKAGRVAAVLLLGGIGCYSVDVASNPQDPYMRIAHDVSRSGFIVMRVEKSGIGDSQGPPCASVDLAAEERMYAAAFTALQRDPRVDPGKMYLLGHSIGTIEAARLAKNKPVAGVIAAEAVGRDWPEYEVRNLRRQLELSGDPPSQVDEALAEKQECMVRLLLEKQPEDRIERTMPSCKTPNGVYPVAAAYMQQVSRINAIGEWSKVTAPVLAIYGTSDFVTEQADHERIVQVLNARRPGSATLQLIQGMDHLLFTAPSPKAAMDAFSAGVPRTYDDAFGLTVVQWLRIKTGQTPTDSRSTSVLSHSV